ncbi:MAG: hypothetical protein QM628_00345 [Propionicimonas sp.]
MSDQTLAEAAWEHYADHAPRTWRCPLCDFAATWVPARTSGLPVSITRHAAERHPAYLPDKPTIAEMLEAIPLLVHEAWLTVDAPNPDGARVGSRGASRDELVLSVVRPEPDSPTWTRAPKTVALSRALSTALESSLFAPVLECSRIVWEALDAATKAAHPQPIGEPSWSTEIAWLRSAWADAQAYLDPADFAWIESELRGVWRSVAAMAGVRPKPKNLCPDCRAPMHLAGDWMTCDAGHQHPGPKRLEREWRRKAPMATKDLCEALRVPQGTLFRWHHEKRIKPVRSEGKRLWWLPWDVIGLRYPDIVKGIDERDVA